MKIVITRWENQFRNGRTIVFSENIEDPEEINKDYISRYFEYARLVSTDIVGGISCLYEIWINGINIADFDIEHSDSFYPYWYIDVDDNTLDTIEHFREARGWNVYTS